MNPAQILLIEDNPADALLIKLALDQQGIPYELIEYSSGADAVSALCGADTKDAVDLDAILLDLNTPKSDGFEVLRILRKQFPQVPVSILTSSHARSDRERAAREGARYLEKEADLKLFLSTVGDAVEDMLHRTV